MPTAADSYLIREARTDEQSSLLSFLEEQFFPREYLNMVYLRKNKHMIDEAEKKIIAEDVKRKYTIVVTNLPCLVVIHKETEKIVGTVLMLLEENPKFASTKNIGKDYTEKQNSTPWHSKLLADFQNYVLTSLNSSVDVFSEFPSQRTALKLLYFCVHSEHSRRNLAMRLLQGSVDYAEKKRVGFVYGLFVSLFGQKAAEKTGFQKLNYVDILSLRDNDGNRVFEGEESYVASFMAKQLKHVSD